ncbi:MAG: hypothetical protein IAE87_17585 [Rhodobacteraceae bacterium]|nr:hypothetical protein [Paracoccaceae bacterium]
MGFSTPKEPFDLAAFLREKGVPRSRRRPNWKNPHQNPAPPPAAEAPAPKDEDQAE